VRPGVAVPFAAIDQAVGVPVTAPPPEPAEVTPNVDVTRQFMAGVGYEADVTDKIWLRGAVLKTHYRKQVRPAGAAPQTNSDTPWLYDLAATYAPTDSLTLFATTVRGLEESGTAPNNAANRNEVLPAVMATQYEFGARYRIGAGVTFIGSLFEISKPVPGLDTANVYRLIGQARHRGVELSLTGRPAPGFNVVGGLALLEPARLGELVDKGLIRDRAAGIPAVTGLVNLTYQFPFLDGFSIDSQVNYTSARLLNPRTGINTPAYATVDIGARYTFKLGGSSATLRARIGNAFDVDAWMAMRSETMTRVNRRAFRLSLTTNFDHPGLFD
jgi:iron complex outermembrane receptor protein